MLYKSRQEMLEAISSSLSSCNVDNINNGLMVRFMLGKTDKVTVELAFDGKPSKLIHRIRIYTYYNFSNMIDRETYDKVVSAVKRIMAKVESDAGFCIFSDRLYVSVTKSMVEYR